MMGGDDLDAGEGHWRARLDSGPLIHYNVCVHPTEYLRSSMAGSFMAMIVRMRQE
jgi:hypothetical protein